MRETVLAVTNAVGRGLGVSRTAALRVECGCGGERAPPVKRSPDRVSHRALKWESGPGKSQRPNPWVAWSTQWAALMRTGYHCPGSQPSMPGYA